MTRAINALIQRWIEHRKFKRVIQALELEAARLRLTNETRDVARYVDQLKQYLEQA